MSKFKDISEFEDLLKDTLQGHSTPAPPDVWSSVAAGTGQSAGAFTQITSFFGSATNILKVALFAGGIAAIGVVTYNENTKDTPTIRETTVAKAEVDSAETSLPSTLSSKENIAAEKIANQSTDTKFTKEKKQTLANNKDANSSESSATNTKSGAIKANPETATSPKNLSSKSEKPSSGSISILASNLKPCKGETIILRTSQKGDWLLNNKPLATNTDIIEYKCEESGSLKFTFEQGENRASTVAYVQQFTTKILTDKINESEFYYSLDDKSIIANWYLDGVLKETNTSTYMTEIQQVGEHKIKAIPVNQSCASPISTSTTIAKKGSLEIFDVFTPGGDGSNDIYKVEITNYDNFFIQIFNPEGKLVYASQNPEEGWNGRLFNLDTECANGIYVAKVSYTLNGESPQSKNVKITLKRP